MNHFLELAALKEKEGVEHMEKQSFLDYLNATEKSIQRLFLIAPKPLYKGLFAGK